LKGFVFFRLSYFDCSDLQLFAIFMAGKSVCPRCVQMVSKTKQNTLLQYSEMFSVLVLGYTVVFQINRTSEIML